jgi:AcrR family transcriptional regulator
MQDKSLRRSNELRSSQMRTRLLTAARALFVQFGFVATSTPAIVKAAGATRGALYHHFADKQAIFWAVIDAEAQQVAQAIEDTDRPEMAALDRLLAGVAGYLGAMTLPGRARLLLIDAPVILGRTALREIEAQHGDESLRVGLQEAMASGDLPQLPIVPLTSMLSAMFERAATDLSEGEPQEAYLSVAKSIITGLALFELRQ